MDIIPFELISKVTILTALAIVFLPPFIMDAIESRGLYGLAFSVSIAVFIAGLFLILAGFSMVGWWSDVLVNNDGQHISDVSTNRRKGGAFLLVVEFWPYVLIAIGGFVSYNSTYMISRFNKLRQTN